MNEAPIVHTPIAPMKLVRHSVCLLALLLAACSSTSSSLSSASVQTLENADASAFFGGNALAPSTPAFNLAARTAISGNDTELAYLMSLSQFAEGEGAKAYGAYLNEMRNLIGRVRFHEVLSRQPNARRDTVKTMMAEAAAR